MNDVHDKILALVDNGRINDMSLGEIAEYLGLKYRSQPKHHIDKMLTDGTLVRNPDGNLARPASDRNRSMISLPVMGNANCGIPMMYANNTIEGVIHVSPSALGKATRIKKGMFAVKAVGDSMNEATINGKRLEDGDFAVVAPTDWSIACEGDYILSVIDGMGNIKKLHIDDLNSRIVLKSQSRDYYEDIIIHLHDLYLYQIAGKVIDVVKSLRKPRTV